MLLKKWIPILIGVIVMASSVVLWRAMSQRERANFDKRVHLKATFVNDDLYDNIQSQVDALVRMGKRWELKGKPSRQEWEFDAGLYIKHFASLQAIEWVDPTYHVRWVVPLAGNESEINLYKAFEERRRNAFNSSRETGQAALTRVIALPRGGKGLIACVPLYVKGDFQGFIIGIYRAQELINGILLNMLENDYSVSVSDGEDEIFASDPGAKYDARGQESDLGLYGVTWKVRVWPKPQYLAETSSYLPELTLLAGIISSIMLASAVHFAQNAWLKERHAEQANIKLQQEISERKKAEKELWGYKGQLEGLVDARTAELKAVNEKLLFEVAIRKSAEEAVARHSMELERSNAELEQFAYVASHDLQEPLRIIAGYTQLLAKRYKGRLDSDADEFIAYAVDGATRMQRLINDLLAYSRVGRAMEFETVECAEVLKRTKENLKAAIEDSGATITNDPLPTIVADPSLLYSLFLNLINNAIKYRGAAAPLVHVSAVDRPGEWLFSVKDNGIGIDPRHFDQIFAIFQRLHAKTEYPGSGIGLSICKKAVESHGGRIWVESQPGEGSIFYFTIPNREVDNNG